MKKIRLNKKIYKNKDVENLLGNNMDFTSFKPKKPTSNNFFKLYNENFYTFSKQAHNYFIVQSKKYIGQVVNSRQGEIDNLNTELERLQLKLDSVDKEHPYFEN